ncbi:MAG: colicin import rane protein [Massilia sp.]|jgi:colicin import membrane protein
MRTAQSTAAQSTAVQSGSVRFALRHAALALMLGLLAACASNSPAPPSETVAPTTSVAQAEERLANVAAERAAIEARYAAREAVCYEKFFVNDCLDEARQRRRSALAVQRAVEVEAEYFIRKNKVDERDRAMAEAEAEYQAQEARAAANPPEAPKGVEPLPPARPTAVNKRMAARNARLQQEAASAQAEAAKRAANVADYEERRRKSEERQRVVAQRKAEREAKRAAARAEQEKAAAEQKAAAQKPISSGR